MQGGTDTMQGGWTLYRGDGHYSRGGTDSTIEGTDTLQGGRTLYRGDGHFAGGTDTLYRGDGHFTREERTLYKGGERTLDKKVIGIL